MGKIDRAEAAVLAETFGVAPAPASRAARTPPPNQVLAIVCVAMVLANLDLFIVNVGLPNIARDLGSRSLEDLSWVLNGYAITYAALLVFFGRWTERHRRDRSLTLGVAVFTLASAAFSFDTLIPTLQPCVSSARP